MENRNELGDIPPDQQAAFHQLRQKLIDRSVELIMARGSFQGFDEHDAVRILTVGMSFTVQTLDALMVVHSKELLVQQLKWGRTYLTEQGISPSVVLKNLESLKDAMQECLPESKYPAVHGWFQIVLTEQEKLSRQMD